MTTPPGQSGPLWYLSFEARSIRDTGRCPRDPGGRANPYPHSEIAKKARAEIGWGVTCPVCGSAYKRLQILEVMSSGNSPFLRHEQLSTAAPSLARDSARRLPTRGATDAPKTSKARGPVARSNEVGASSPQRASPNYPARGLTVSGFSSGKRRTEPIGTDSTDFDNSESFSSSVETLHISHTTAIEVQLDEEAATLTGGGGSVALIGLADFSGKLEQQLRRHHSVGMSSTLNFQRTSEIHVPPRKHVRVTLAWKRVWQDGVIKLSTRAGEQIELPYSMTVDLSFDKKTVDLT